MASLNKLHVLDDFLHSARFDIKVPFKHLSALSKESIAVEIPDFSRAVISEDQRRLNAARIEKIEGLDGKLEGHKAINLQVSDYLGPFR